MYVHVVRVRLSWFFQASFGVRRQQEVTVVLQGTIAGTKDHPVIENNACEYMYNVIFSAEEEDVGVFDELRSFFEEMWDTSKLWLQTRLQGSIVNSLLYFSNSFQLRIFPKRSENSSVSIDENRKLIRSIFLRCLRNSKLEFDV